MAFVNRTSLAVTLGLFVGLTLAAPARAEKVEDPSLKDAKVGDWVELRMVMPAELHMTSTTKQTITAATNDEVTIEAVNQTVMNGKPLPETKLPPQKRPRMIEKAEADKQTPPAVKSTQAHEKTKGPDGKEYDCLVIEVKVQGKTAKTWICRDLPLGGLLKTEVDGQVTMELTGWGRGK